MHSFSHTPLWREGFILFYSIMKDFGRIVSKEIKLDAKKYRYILIYCLSRYMWKKWMEMKQKTKEKFHVTALAK
jgi:hypothetical protein